MLQPETTATPLPPFKRQEKKIVKIRVSVARMGPFNWHWLVSGVNEHGGDDWDTRFNGTAAFKWLAFRRARTAYAAKTERTVREFEVGKHSK